MELVEPGLIELQPALPSSDGGGELQRRIILMPAAFQPLAQFRDHGFDTRLRAAAAHTEVLFAAPRLTHLNDRRWLPALHQQLIVPARARGMQVWLGGVSLGGFMALRLAAQYPDVLDGLCLLAPYLGSRIVAAELEHAESQRLRQTGEYDQILDEDDDERRIWRYVTGLHRSMNTTKIFLGFGADDRFADTQRLLARSLPATGVTTHVIPGGHDWAVWCALWQAFVEQWR